MSSDTSHITKHKISVENVRQLIAKAMGWPLDAVSIEFDMEPVDDSACPSYEVSGITLTTDSSVWKKMTKRQKRDFFWTRKN